MGNAVRGVVCVIGLGLLGGALGGCTTVPSFMAGDEVDPMVIGAGQFAEGSGHGQEPTAGPVAGARRGIGSRVSQGEGESVSGAVAADVPARPAVVPEAVAPARRALPRVTPY